MDTPWILAGNLPPNVAVPSGTMLSISRVAVAFLGKAETIKIMSYRHSLTDE